MTAFICHNFIRHSNNNNVTGNRDTFSEVLPLERDQGYAYRLANY